MAALICHTDSTGAQRAELPLTDTSSTFECPICKGLGAFQAAVLPLPCHALPPDVLKIERSWSQETFAHVAALLSPHNRGPPQA